MNKIIFTISIRKTSNFTMMKPYKALILCSFLTFANCSVTSALASNRNSAPNTSSKKESDENNQRILEIKDSIPYTYNFDADDKNFESGTVHFFKGKTKRDYTVLVNVHDGSPLNISAEYKKGFRTLSWGTPFEAALRQAMSAVHHAHDQSALLTSWTGKKFRTYVSFVIIPKDTLMEFKIGYASPQISNNPNMLAESRPGGGMQMRLKYLPARSIILTEALIEGKKVEGKGTYSLRDILKGAVENYNKENVKNKLPLDITLDDGVFLSAEEYAQDSLNIIPETQKP